MKLYLLTFDCFLNYVIKYIKHINVLAIITYIIIRPVLIYIAYIIIKKGKIEKLGERERERER
jgi:hypothetical protein